MHDMKSMHAKSITLFYYAIAFQTSRLTLIGLKCIMNLQPDYQTQLVQGVRPLALRRSSSNVKLTSLASVVPLLLSPSRLSFSPLSAYLAVPTTRITFVLVTRMVRSVSQIALYVFVVITPEVAHSFYWQYVYTWFQMRGGGVCELGLRHSLRWFLKSNSTA